MPEEKKSPSNQKSNNYPAGSTEGKQGGISTNGGAYIQGDVNTGGGDFTGRDSVTIINVITSAVGDLINDFENKVIKRAT